MTTELLPTQAHVRGKGDEGGVMGKKTLTQAHVQNVPSLLNPSWDKEADLHRRNINVLFGKTNGKYDSMFALPSRCRGDDKAADEKCRAVDEMLPLKR